ncbi:MAG TPA: acyl-CoA dehydrogenase, partial [Actinomycetota bacterium]|nr:acyl-CoA dehydrogenase [Actinomycetota bacterium]
MDFDPSPQAEEYIARLLEFMDAEVYPAESVYAEQLGEHVAAGIGHQVPPVVETLKASARERGLWNLFLPDVSGLSVTDYAPLAEITGRSLHLAPEALNCAAPDTG